VKKFAYFLENNESSKNNFNTLKAEGFLGNGGAGTVFSLNNDICLKVMDNRPLSDNYHDYDNEALVAQRINGLKTESVKTPNFFAYYRTLNNREMLMEKIEGVSLQDIFNGNANFPKKFIDNYFIDGKFDSLSFDDELNSFLDLMHDKKVVHGDLASRNIMLDIEGKIVVIDTGRSKFLDGLSDEDSMKLKEDDDKGVEDIMDDFVKYFNSEKFDENKVAVIHYKFDKGDSKIESEIFSNTILDTVKKYLEEHEGCGLCEVESGLCVSPNKNDLLLGLKSINYGNNVYYIGFKND